MNALSFKDFKLNHKIIKGLNKIGIITLQDLYDHRDWEFKKFIFFNEKDDKKIRDAINQLEVLEGCSNIIEQTQSMNNDEPVDVGAARAQQEAVPRTSVVNDVHSEQIKQNNEPLNDAFITSEVNEPIFSIAKEEDIIREEEIEDVKESAFSEEKVDQINVYERELDESFKEKYSNKNIESEDVGLTDVDEDLNEDKLEDRFATPESKTKDWPEVSLEDNVDIIRKILEESEDGIHIYPSLSLGRSLSYRARNLEMKRMELVHGLGFIYIWNDGMRTDFMLDDDKNKYRQIVLDCRENKDDKYVLIQPGNEYYDTIASRANKLGMTIDEYCGMNGLIRKHSLRNNDALRKIREKAIALADSNYKSKRIKTKTESKSVVSDEETINDSLEKLLDDNLVDEYVEQKVIHNENAEAFKELQNKLIDNADSNTLAVDLNDKENEDFINYFWECAYYERMLADNLLALFGCTRKHLKRNNGSFVPTGYEKEYSKIHDDMRFIIRKWMKEDGKIYFMRNSLEYELLSQRLDKIDMTIEDFANQIYRTG